MKARKYVYITTLTLTAILFCWLLYIMPPFVDDLHFAIPLPADISCSERWGAVCQMIYTRFFTDVFRISNQFLPPLLMGVPQWVRVGFMTLLLVLMLEGGRRAICVSYASGLTYVWIAAAIILLPWFDMMMSTSFYMNYVLPSVLTLWLIHLVLNKALDDMSMRKYAGVLLVAFLAGWAHEGISVPLATFLGVLFLIECIRTKAFNRRFFIVGLLLCAGILLEATSPVLWKRVEIQGHYHPFWEMVFLLGPALALILVFAIVAIWGVLKNRALWPFVVAILASCGVNLIIGILFNGGHRTMWYACLVSIYGSLYIINKNRGEFWERKRPYVIAGVVSMSLVITNLVAAIHIQAKYSDDMWRVVNLYQNCDNQYGEVYADIHRPAIDLSLLKTSARALNENAPLILIRQYYGDASHLSILPEKLRTFTGSADSITVMDNMVIVHPTSVDPYVQRAPHLYITTQYGEMESRYRTDIFHKDSTEYVLLMPHVTILNPGVQIESARITM